MPYVGSELDRVRKFHTKQISGNDAINFLEIYFDKEYAKEIGNLIIQNVLYNKRIRPALDEMRRKYGYKLQEFNDLVWEAFSCFDSAS